MASAASSIASIRFIASPAVGSLLDVRFHHHGKLRREQVLQRLQGRERALRVLFAVAAGEPDAADHLAVDDDRESADEGGEAAFEAELDAERLVAGQRRSAGRPGEEMRRALVPGRGERLVPRDLRPGDARAIHALEGERKAALVAYAHRLRDAERLGLPLRGLHYGARILQFELECRSHSP